MQLGAATGIIIYGYIIIVESMFASGQGSNYVFPNIESILFFHSLGHVPSTEHNFH